MRNMAELNVKAWASTGAILWGTYIFIASLFAMGNVTFFWFSSQTFELLGLFYPGLSASIGGAFLGLLYGAACGAICAGLFSGLHNFMAEKLG